MYNARPSFATHTIGCQVIKPNVLPVPEVARLKGTSRQAIYGALERGTLNEVRVGSTRLIARDSALSNYLARPPQPNRSERTAES